MKVPSIMDVVIGTAPANIIKGILKQDLTSVAPEKFGGDIVHSFIGVVVMGSKL